MNATVFYILAAASVLATVMAISRRKMVHAVVYLIQSFFAFALIFYMMGAPLVAALEVIVYAGAIMVLFLFIVMMLEVGKTRRKKKPFWLAWGPAGLVSLVILWCSAVLFSAGPSASAKPAAVFISPRQFGYSLFTGQMLGVEIVSLLLLFALVGSLYLGRRD